MSTGGGDFTHPKGTAVKVDGGWQVSGRKQFASQSPVGAVMSTMFTYDDPERGRRVLNIAVPFGEGVQVDRELGHARHAWHGEQRRRRSTTSSFPTTRSSPTVRTASSTRRCR